MPLGSEGELVELFNDVRIVTAPCLLRIISAPSYNSVRTFIGKVVSAVVRFLSNHSECCFFFFMKYVFHRIKGREYAVIVAAQESMPSRVVAAFPHPHKVAWVRCDYLNYLHRSNKERESFYPRFNSIVCVSNQGSNSFLSVYPELKDRVYCIPNPQDSQYIIARASAVEEDTRFVRDSFTIVSVGRMDPVKRYDVIPHIARILLNKGIKFKWYLIGDGIERQKIVEQITKWGVGENVILLGVKTNPHYYIKKSDLYVCLSSTESCPRVVNEAKILGTPTVATNFPSVFEFIENGKTGWIGNLESIPTLIEQAIENKERYQSVVRNLESFEFDNTPLVSMIEQRFSDR